MFSSPPSPQLSRHLRHSLSMLLRPIPLPTSSSLPRHSLLLFPPNHRRHRPLLRRRRSRPPRSFLVHSSLDNPSSLYLLAPAFALISAAGTALFLSSSSSNPDGSVVSSAVGEWVLLASPTPFNRSVFLRCPSIEFEDGGELLDGVSDRLVTESRHYVNLAIREDAEEEPEEEEEVLYQRICVRTKDGGVLSVDWPEHLDLRKEHGLDTTVVIVPGTTQGSMERKVKLFVRDALRHGYFPVVMNPRGCSGSPLTTPRLFTAADSDDISTIVRFLNTMRPWTSLVGVSWGYGSNMLTKYLAEVGDSTPLTAAVCIDNPFDLDEATRSIPLTSSWDQELLSGLIDIVVANKELFLGKGKGFHVQEALSAATLRDFDKAISMVPHGCDSIEEFYAKISTRRSIENVKTPVLFIENDNGTVPLFSIPCAEISENPFTSLLLCSYLSSGTISSNESAVMWCQQLAIEWLSAVELALLKGRHPLLEDIDISINPSKDFSFVNGRVAKNKPGRKYRESPPLPLNKGPLNGYLIGPPVEVDSSNGKIGKSTEKEAADSFDVKEEELEAGDESQVLQTASVVMNMLDVTMPGTLNDEQKKKVLTAMERGETLMKALQEAVPEDVRGKLTSAATEIIQSQKSNLSLNVLKRVGWTKPPLDAKPKTQDNSAVKETVNRDSEVKDANSPPEQSASPSENSSSAEMGNHEKNSQSSGDVETSSTVPRAQEQQDNSQPLVSSEGGQKPTSDGQPVSTDTNTPKDEVKRVDAPVIEKSAPVSTDTSTPKDEVKRVDAPVIEKSPAESQNLESHETVLPQHGGAERQVSDTSKSKDAATIPNNTVVDPNLHNNSSKIEEQPRVASQPPSINVSQALDALTGFDDSTQMAVNSVFGVIENMIEQLEKKSENNESTTDAKASENAKSQNSEIGEEPKNKVKVAQDEINSSLSSNEVEDDAQMETSKDSILSSPESNSNQQKDRDLSHDNLKQDILKRLSNAQELYYSMQYAQYFPRNVQKQLESKELDSDSATDLILDPQEGKWKMVNQAQSPDADSETSPQPDNVIEPSYVILESSTNGAPSKQQLAAARKQIALFIREELLGALETEVRRKLGVLHLDFEDFDIRLVYDLEELATSVSENVVLKSDLNLELFSGHDIPKGKFGRIESEYLIKTVSCAVHEANHLMTLLPMGLVVGSMLACLRKYFEISELHGEGVNKIKEGYVPKCSDSSDGENDIRAKDVYHHEEEKNDKDSEHLSTSEEKLTTDSEEKLATDRRQGQGLMVGTVTAAIGASALLVQHQKNEQGGEETPTMPKQKDIISGVQTKLEDETRDKNSNLVSSLAEKAMSVAGPVVPTKSDGEVDHERLVAVLAELGQKGGILRLVGKVALLWGGIRGAMSLTDRLISFLHIGERPLLLRLLGFVCMALLLWSPVVIPLLPALVQSWSIRASTGIVGYACVVGLYTSLTILVMIWGKRIRGYDDPVAQYGLDLTSTSRVHEFLKGLVGGIMVVFSVHSVNTLLGYASFSWPLSVPPFSVGTLAVLKAYGNVLFLVVRGLLTAIGISMVEELLFRSWLEEEIAVDHGYYQAIVFSGIAFSLIHRSVHAMPGFLIMSILLSGIKQRSMGKLAAPIGLRAGIMSASHILLSGGFISYYPSTPIWFNSSYPLHPFDGAVGLLICLMLAILFFPQKHPQREGDST